MDEIVRRLNGLWIVIYCAMISAAFGLQVFDHEVPCPLCYLQRVAMLSICASAFLNLWFGVRIFHYGMILIGSLLGAFIAGRQILLHICLGFPTFGVPFWGVSLYTWSFISFACSIFMTALLLLMYHPTQEYAAEERPFWVYAVGTYLVLIILGNVGSVFMDCGFTICKD